MPGEFESILTKLQGKLGKQTIKRASTINRPRPKFEVQQIDIFNKFNRRNPKADGGRVGFRGGGAYQGGRSSTGRSSTSRGPAGGASAGGNYGGNRNPQQTYGGSIFRGGGGGGQTTTPKTSPIKTNTKNPFSKTNLQTHFANNQLLKNAVTKGILTNQEYNILGGYDAKKTLGLGPVDTALTSGAYNIVQSILGKQPFSEIYGDVKRNVKGATNVSPELQTKYESIINQNKNIIGQNLADGGSVNGSEQAALRKKVEELMDDGYDFGEAVREAMRQGYDDGGKVKKAPKGFMYNKKGKLVKKLNAKTIKEIKKRFPNKKYNFKEFKLGVPPTDPDHDKIRFMDPERKKLEKQNKAKPESRARAKARAKEYYATEKENILQRAKDRYRSDAPVGKTGKTLKQLTKEKNIERIIKIQDTIGIFPNGYMKSGNKKLYKPELAVWRDLYDSTTKQGQDRWVLPKQYKDNVPLNEAGKPKWAKDNYYKNIKFVDQKTGEIIKLDETIKGKGKTLKEYLDTTIAKETGQKRVFQKAKDGYELKNKIKGYEIDFKGNKESLGTLFAKASSAKSGDTVLSAFEVHHPYGKKTRWWDNQVALREANRELNYIDSRLQRAYKNAPTQAQKNKIFKQFGKEVDKLPGGISYFFEGQQVGSKMPTLKSILDEGAKFYKIAKPVAKRIAKAVPLVGTAIGIADVANAYEQGVRNPIDLFAAYQISPEAAVSAKRYREDPEYRQEQIRNLPNIEGEASLDNFTSYFNGGIVSLKGVK